MEGYSVKVVYKDEVTLKLSALSMLLMYEMSKSEVPWDEEVRPLHCITVEGKAYWFNRNAKQLGGRWEET